MRGYTVNGCHVHTCGPWCYGIADAGCCEDHPDCVYDSIPPVAAFAGPSGPDCWHGGGSGDTFEGETTFEAALRPKTCYHVCVRCL